MKQIVSKEGKPASKHHVHKKPTLEDTIEHVFAVLRDQSELENGILFHQNFSIFMTRNVADIFGVCGILLLRIYTGRILKETYNAPDNEHIKMQLEESKKA